VLLQLLLLLWIWMRVTCLVELSHGTNSAEQSSGAVGIPMTIAKGCH
jgi:hypothetical protein